MLPKRERNATRFGVESYGRMRNGWTVPSHPPHSSQLTFFYYYYKFITNDKRNLLKKLILLIHELTSSLKVSFQRYFHEFTVRRLCSSIKSLSHFFLMDYVIDLSSMRSVWYDGGR